MSEQSIGRMTGAAVPVRPVMPAGRHARISQRPPLRRTIAEAMALIRPAPTAPLDALLAAAPRGDGHAVLVLPGLFCGDRYTAVVREYLDALGYAAHGWDLGTNVGPTRRLLRGVVDRLVELSDRHGPVSIVGFSLGGLFGRWLCLQMPDRVRQIITVCSPIHEPARNFCLPLDPLLSMWRSVDLAKLAREIARPVPVPGTYLFSGVDGVVSWSACCDASVSPEDNIEIGGPHMLIARNPKMLAVLAERLARRPEQDRALPV
jgi:pimeloyl-ACP methyl ester carboxylesterase